MIGVLAQIQQLDVTTVGGAVALLSVHAHTWWQTQSIKRHVDAEIAKHVRTLHPREQP